MIIAHYAHRLPADYDIGIIRDRAGRRGHLFDAIPELYFKAFLLRERGRFGANQNEYSSLYLWRKDEGFRDFLADGRTRSVTDSFGRPQIETRFVLDAHKGEGREARFLFKQERATARPQSRPAPSPPPSASIPRGGSSPACCCRRRSPPAASRRQRIRCCISPSRCWRSCRRLTHARASWRRSEARWRM